MTPKMEIGPESPMLNSFTKTPVPVPPTASPSEEVALPPTPDRTPLKKKPESAIQYTNPELPPNTSPVPEAEPPSTLMVVPLT